MNRKKRAPNVWAPENAAPKRSDGAEDVKDADITGVDVDFEAERRWLAEGELDEGRRARDLAPRRAANGRTDERAMRCVWWRRTRNADSPSRTAGVGQRRRRRRRVSSPSPSSRGKYLSDARRQRGVSFASRRISREIRRGRVLIRRRRRFVGDYSIDARARGISRRSSSSVGLLCVQTTTTTTTRCYVHTRDRGGI